MLRHQVKEVRYQVMKAQLMARWVLILTQKWALWAIIQFHLVMRAQSLVKALQLPDHYQHLEIHLYCQVNFLFLKL